MPPSDRSALIVREHAQRFTGDIRELDELMKLIGDARFVLIGEASHGTHEFYKTRAQITQRLISDKNFNAVAAEADWPDAWSVNAYLKGTARTISDANQALGEFRRFPTWMWRNADVLAFVEWLKKLNDRISGEGRKIGF